MHNASDGEIFALLDTAVAADSEMPKVEFKDGRGGIGSGAHKDISFLLLFFIMLKLEVIR